MYTCELLKVQFDFCIEFLFINVTKADCSDNSQNTSTLFYIIYMNLNLLNACAGQYVFVSDAYSPMDIVVLLL